MDSSPCSEGWMLCYVIATYRFWLSHPNRRFQREFEAILLFSPPLYDIGRRTPRPRVVSMAISNVQRLMCSFNGRRRICLGLEDHSAWHPRSSSARNSSWPSTAEKRSTASSVETGKFMTMGNPPGLPPKPPDKQMSWDATNNSRPGTNFPHVVEKDVLSGIEKDIYWRIWS